MRCFRLIITTLPASLAFWLSACKKDITPVKNFDPTVEIVSLIKNEDEIMPAKYVFVQFNQFPDNVDTTTSFNINVFGKFTNDTTGAVVNAGNIIINDRLSVGSGPNNLYEYKFDQASLPFGKASMGNYIDLEITGSNAADSLRRKLYIPKPVFLN